MEETRAYDRGKAVAYAHQWAYSRNPAYYDFSELGGDCTNFASQILYAGTGVMNYTPMMGWFYVNANQRTASWTGVQYFYNFLLLNRGPGPFAKEVALATVEPGDFIQFTPDGTAYTHTLAVVEIGRPATKSNVLVAAHTFNADERPLSSYTIRELRCIHILGYRRQ